MLEWLERLLRNHRGASSTTASAITHVRHACKKQTNKIELNLVLTLQHPGIIKRHK